MSRGSQLYHAHPVRACSALSLIPRYARYKNAEESEFCPLKFDVYCPPQTKGLRGHNEAFKPTANRQPALPRDL
jgi:hypothetical protein